VPNYISAGIGQSGKFAGWTTGRSRFFLFTTATRMALGLTQLHTHLAPRTFSLGVKRLEHEADNLPPSSVEVTNARGSNFTVHTFS
jgi:hypothetical protein